MYHLFQIWAGLSNHYYTTRSLLTYEGLTNMPKFIPVPSVKDYPGSKAVQFSGGVEGVVKSNHLYIDPSVLVLNHYLTKVMTDVARLMLSSSSACLSVCLPATLSAVL